MSKTFTYTVRGSWPFPLDMLRHDGSAAATAEDQASIDRYAADSAPDAGVFEPVEVTLVGPWRPNTARWESFGWEVPSDEDWKWRKRLEAEDRREAALRESGLAKLTPEEHAALRLAA